MLTSDPDTNEYSTESWTSPAAGSGRLHSTIASLLSSPNSVMTTFFILGRSSPCSYSLVARRRKHAKESHPEFATDPPRGGDGRGNTGDILGTRRECLRSSRSC